MIFSKQHQLILQSLFFVMLVSCGKQKTAENTPGSSPAIKDADAFFSEMMAKFALPQTGHSQTYSYENYEYVTINGNEVTCIYTDTVTQTITLIDRDKDVFTLEDKTNQTPKVNNPMECPLHTTDFQASKTQSFSIEATLNSIRESIKMAFDPNYFCQSYESCSDAKLIEVSDVVFKGINAVYVKFEYFSKASEETVLRETYTAKDDLALNVFEEKWSYKSDGFVFFHKNHIKFSRPN